MSEGADERGDDDLRRLIRLTREALSEDGGPPDEGGLVTLREERAMRPAARRRRWPITVLLALVALALVALGAVAAARLARRAPPLSFEIIQEPAGQPAEATAYPGPDPRAAESRTRIRFSDGSEIGLEGGARAEVRDLGPNGGRVALVRGRVRAQILPRAQTRWEIAAGPYLAESGGMVIDVDWSDATRTLQVWLREGTARLSGPLVGTGMVLAAGQHFATRDDNKVLLDTSPEPR